jgi:hypothetical protein
MKPGDCYIDDYYEPDTIVVQVTDVIQADGHACKVVYSSDPLRMRIGEKVSRYSDDEDLIPVAMITIDNKVILINL